MRKHNWNFTIVNHAATAIEYAVICCDDEFHFYVQRMRDVWMQLETQFGPVCHPTVELDFPHVALVKVLAGASEEAVEESIDNTSGFWALLPLQPIQELLHESGHLKRDDVFELLRETEVSGSKARLCMDDPDHIYINIDPGDSHTHIDTSYINIELLPPLRGRVTSRDG